MQIPPLGFLDNTGIIASRQPAPRPVPALQEPITIDTPALNGPVVGSLEDRSTEPLRVALANQQEADREKTAHEKIHGPGGIINLLA
jgi:hypothetical protein